MKVEKEKKKNYERKKKGGKLQQLKTIQREGWKKKQGLTELSKKKTKKYDEKKKQKKTKLQQPVRKKEREIGGERETD